ncbi:replication protein [Escherichia coli]
MTNTAKILNFGRGNFAGQERNVADLDDGYARLSNMLLEAYSGADLTKRQFKVLLAILRKTYGWNKLNCAPDLGQLMQPDSIDIVPG